MVIIGAKGFAKEVLQVLFDNGEITDELCFFDDVSVDLPSLLYDKYKIIRSVGALRDYFTNHSAEFILGIGGSSVRRELWGKISTVGGKAISLVSNKASVGNFGTVLDEGVCVLTYAVITNDVHIGFGSIVNKGAIISHDVSIGRFCEISPGAKVLGRATIGNYCEIGSNSTILPDIVIGSCVQVGAGAVVTKDVPDNSVVVGVPARDIKR